MPGDSDSGLNVSPDSWENVDGTEGYHFDQDSDSTSSVENINTFTDPRMEPGEVWAFKVRLSISSEPTSGPVFIEIRDDGNNNILARSAIGDYGGFETTLQATLPTYEVSGDFSSPASSSADPEIRVNNTAGDGFNFFVETYAIRLRRPIDLNADVQDNAGSLDSGKL